MAQRQLYSGLDLYDWRGTGPNGRTKAVDVEKWQQNQEDIRHLPGAFPVQSVVITDGQITPTAAALSVDTEGGAPADDLTAIAPGDLHAGMLLALCSVDAGRKVTIKNSAGASGIQTLDGKDVVLDTQYAVMLRLVSTESLSLWREEPGPLRLQLTVSTPDTLGGVKVQAGDDDGLEMIGDKLRVRKASATQRGSVLASETAKAGAVPLGGADGALDKSWRERKPGEYIFSHEDEVEGALRCDGSALSRVTYADLFAVIGTTFGEGDGKTTFNLPDARGKVLEGATDSPGKILQPGLPDIEGDAKLYNSAIGVAAQACSGAFKQGEAYNSGVVAATSTEVVAKLQLKASLGNTIYGASDTVQMAAITTNIFIVY